MDLKTTLDWLRHPFAPRHSADTVPHQRRRFRRVSVSLSVRCLKGRHAVSGRVLDLAVGGMRLEVEGRVRPGDVISISYTGPLPNGRRATDSEIRARVTWVRSIRHGSEIGVAWVDASTLLERSWVKMILMDQGLQAHRVADSRREVRAATRLPITIRGHQGDAPVDGMMLDLSVGGALVETGRDLPLGSVVQVEGGHATFGQLVCEGRVVRRVVTEDGRPLLGLRFENLPHSRQSVLSRYLHALLGPRTTLSLS